jgi:tetratricopeptide (TPR) repeat protein
MLEMQGSIDRKSFHFIADNCKVWHQGNCIVDLYSTFVIDAEVSPFDGEIEVNIDNSEIEEYITDQVSFSEISMLNDRILWSNNMLGGGEGFEYKDLSLFYCNGILSRIYLNRNNPLIMLEFNSNQQGKIADVENPLKKVAETIRNAKKGQSIDISNVTFVSDSHQRYENGLPVRGLQQCRRDIRIEANTNGCEGYKIVEGEEYIITIFNLDGNHPMWGNNVQVTPKPMKIISQTDEQTVLRGYRCEAMSPFGWIDFNGADYGMTIFHKCGEIDKCTLHMHDRNADIEYYRMADDKSCNKIVSDILEAVDGFNTKWQFADYQSKVRIATESDRIYNMGVPFWKSGNYERAIEYAKQALQVMPTNDDALSMLGNYYNEKDDLNSAILLYKKAIDLGSITEAPYIKLSKIYELKGLLDEARKFRQLWQKKKQELEQKGYL